LVTPLQMMRPLQRTPPRPRLLLSRMLPNLAVHQVHLLSIPLSLGVTHAHLLLLSNLLNPGVNRATPSHRPTTTHKRTHQLRAMPRHLPTTTHRGIQRLRAMPRHRPTTTHRRIQRLRAMPRRLPTTTDRGIQGLRATPSRLPQTTHRGTPLPLAIFLLRLVP
jgi:hypothetical protein